MNSPSINTKPTINQVVATDETTAISTTSTSLENMSATGCALICVAVGVCLVIISNIVVLCLRKKNRRSKQGNKAQNESYGYISPVNVTELDDTTLHDSTLPGRIKVATNNPGNKIQFGGYGYLSPINVTELDDTTPHDNTLSVRNKVTTNIAGKSSNMYEYKNSNDAECQYIDLV